MALTKDQVIATAAPIIAAFGGFAVAKGYLSPEQLTQISQAVPNLVTAVFLLAPVLYGIWTTMRSQKISAAAALPGATVVLDNQAEADKHPTASVVGPNDIVASTTKPAAQ